MDGFPDARQIGLHEIAELEGEKDDSVDFTLAGKIDKAANPR